MSPYKSNCRGIILLINNTFEYEIGRIKKDQNGNCIILELTISGKRITLVNLYGPNEDKPLLSRLVTKPKKDDCAQRRLRSA